ncbi:unnamed protein product [Orchesella dallaii]|uniref:Uncharacterized protein n=1 Tax=Orchesella dallaii TaxID=48710 RepID=A0ABP1R847_9HEXA
MTTLNIAKVTTFAFVPTCNKSSSATQRQLELEPVLCSSSPGLANQQLISSSDKLLFSKLFNWDYPLVPSERRRFSSSTNFNMNSNCDLQQQNYYAENKSDCEHATMWTLYGYLSNEISY